MFNYIYGRRKTYRAGEAFTLFLTNIQSQGADVVRNMLAELAFLGFPCIWDGFTMNFSWIYYAFLFQRIYLLPKTFFFSQQFIFVFFFDIAS